MMKRLVWSVTVSASACVALAQMDPKGSGTGAYSTVGGGYENAATGAFSTVGGGAHNTASTTAAVVSGGFQNNAGADAVVAGGFHNRATGYGSAVGGGSQNLASDNRDVIGGGFYNWAAGPRAVVGGGDGNAATGRWSVIGGGKSNRADSVASAIGGGNRNVTSGPLATVSGGYGNYAEGYASAIPGGRENYAKADSSLAAGFRARAYHAGSFVWSDVSSLYGFGSQRENQFCVRATGGFHLSTQLDDVGSDAGGVQVEAGGSQWLAVSDRNAKTGFSPVDVKGVLKALVGIPVTTWNYKAQASEVRHIGPMAQDFQKAFQVGEDKNGKTIGHMDALGVAYAAIQGLHEELKGRDERLEKADGRIAQAERENQELRKRLERLEELVSSQRAAKDSLQ